MDIVDTYHPLEFAGEKFLISKSQKIYGRIVRGMELATKSEIKAFLVNSLGVHTPSILLDDIASSTVQAYLSSGNYDKCVQIRHRDKKSGGDGYLLLMSQEFWSAWPEKRNRLVRMKAEYLKNIAPDGLCREVEYEELVGKVDNWYPWTPYKAAQSILSDMGRDRYFEVEALRRLIPMGSSRTAVFCDAGKSDACAYQDIKSAYWRALERIGDVFVYPRSEQYISKEIVEITQGEIEISDPIGKIDLEREPGFDYHIDKFKAPDAPKSTRLAIVGIGMGALVNPDQKLEMIYKSKKGFVGDRDIHIRGKRHGVLAESCNLAAEFIREAVFLQKYLAGELCHMALTDGVVMESIVAKNGRLQPTPCYVFDDLGLDYAIKYEGPGNFLYPNCWRIGPHTTTGYEEHEYESPPEEMSDEDFRIIAIPLVMGWSVEKTASWIKSIRNRYEMMLKIRKALKCGQSYRDNKFYILDGILAEEKTAAELVEAGWNRLF